MSLNDNPSPSMSSREKDIIEESTSKSPPAPPENIHISAHHLKYGTVNHADFDTHNINSELDNHARMHAHFELVDARARRVHKERRYLFRRPRPLQYFRGHVLVRDTSERTSGRLELFFDLTFVGLISVLAAECVEHPDGAHLAKYVLTYAPAFLVWTYVRECMDAFWTDDLQQRLLIAYVMVMLVVYGNNATSVEQNLSESPARAAAVATYLLASGGVGSVLLFYSFFVKPWRTQIRTHCIIWIATSGLWIGTIFTDVRTAAGLAAAACILEYSTWGFVYSPIFKRLMHLHYSSAVSIEHEIERFNDFFTLVMGEFLYSVFSHQPAGKGVRVAAGRAALTVLITFSLQLLYVGGSGSKKSAHAIRLGAGRAVSWFTLHLPIVCGLTLAGDAAGALVRENSNVSQGVRWMFCGGYAVGMFGIWILSMLEQDEDKPGELWFAKKYRIAPRVVSALIVVLLPLTSNSNGETESAVEMHVVTIRETVGTKLGRVQLTSTQMLGIVAAVSFATLLWEMISSLDGPRGPAHTEQPKQPFPEAHIGPHGKVETAVATWKWRGRPCFAEPGLYIPDYSHQRQEPLSEKGTLNP